MVVGGGDGGRDEATARKKPHRKKTKKKTPLFPTVRPSLGVQVAPALIGSSPSTPASSSSSSSSSFFLSRFAPRPLSSPTPPPRPAAAALLLLVGFFDCDPRSCRVCIFIRLLFSAYSLSSTSPLWAASSSTFLPPPTGPQVATFRGKSQIAPADRFASRAVARDGRH